MKLPIPQEVLLQHIVALGKTGSGKSSKIRILVEHLLRQDKPVCIIDPKGDWWGMKSSADGKRSGFPIVIFGGAHADVPINAHSGAYVAELFATGNRSCLIDLRGWMPGERTKFFIDFASSLFKHTRGARHLVIDEVHNFAPKGKVYDPDAGKMLHWANRLASEGRGLGLTVIGASQRPQKVHNDFLDSCETLIACRVIHAAARQAVKDWIDGNADPAKGKEVVSQLASMKRTDAWVWSPEIEFGPERITFPMFETYDSFKPQKANAEKLKGWAAVDLEEVKSKLASVVADAQAKDPAVLQRRVAELTRELAAAQKGKAAPRPGTTSPGAAKEDLQAAEQRGFVRGIAATQKALMRDIQSIRPQLIGAIQAVTQTSNAQLRERVEKLFDEIKAAPTPTPPPAAARIIPRNIPASNIAKPVKDLHRTLIKDAANGNLPPGERAVLTACIQYPDGLGRSQLTVLTGYKRSSRDAYIFRLREKGYVETAGDRVSATTDGIAAMPDAEPLPTGEDLREFWRQRLPEGERKVLEILCAAYPDPVARAELDEQTGYRRSSRDAYLSRLSAKELVEEPERGMVRASETLFQ